MTQTPAGWFPDPQMPGQLRYWDGAGWTAHTQPGGAGVAVPNHPSAITALVLGIVSVVLCGLLTGIPAMIIGRKATKEIDASNGAQGGRGLAQGGFWTGLVGTLLTTIPIAIIIGAFLIADTASTTFQETCSVVGSDQGTSDDCD